MHKFFASTTVYRGIIILILLLLWYFFYGIVLTNASQNTIVLSLQTLQLTAITTFLILIIVFIFLLYVRKSSQKREITWSKKGWFDKLSLSFFALVALLISAILIVNFIGIQPESMIIFVNEMNWGQLLLFCFVVALSEEFFFRKMMVCIVRKLNIGLWVLLLFNLLFALPHYYQGLLAVLYAYVTGISFLIYYCHKSEKYDDENDSDLKYMFKDRPLWNLIFLHTFHNFIVLILQLYFE